jgi:hypothetical protein
MQYTSRSFPVASGLNRESAAVALQGMGFEF